MSFIKNNSGQVSVEVVVAVFILLIFFIIIFFQNSVFETERVIIQDSYKEKNSCLEIMFITSQVFFEGSGTSLDLLVDHNFLIFKDSQMVAVSEQFCYFLANVDNDYNLSKGKIKISNLNGVVFFEQVFIN